MHVFAYKFLSNLGILNRCGKKNCDFIWTELHNINDLLVCSWFCIKMRLLLISGMRNEEVLRYMPKLWQKGGCICMAWERYLDYLNAIALSGYKGGSHIETYIDITGIGLSLSAGMAFSDYIEIYKTPIPPLFESVTGHYHVTARMKAYIVTKMFPLILTNFQPNGRIFTITNNDGHHYYLSQ